MSDMKQPDPPWTPSKTEESTYYQNVFNSLDTHGKGCLSGKQVASFFEGSGLSIPVLRQVWVSSKFNASTKTCELGEFVVAMRLVAMGQAGEVDMSLDRLCELATKGMPMAKVKGSLPLTVNRSTGKKPGPRQPQATDPATYALTEEEEKIYRDQFTKIFLVSDVVVPKGQMMELMIETGMAQSLLEKIWSLCDEDCDESMDISQFVVAMHLVKCVMDKAKPIPPHLPERLLKVLDVEARRARKIAAEELAAALEEEKTMGDSDEGSTDSDVWAKTRRNIRTHARRARPILTKSAAKLIAASKTSATLGRSAIRSLSPVAQRVAKTVVPVVQRTINNAAMDLGFKAPPPRNFGVIKAQQAVPIIHRLGDLPPVRVQRSKRLNRKKEKPKSTQRAASDGADAAGKMTADGQSQPNADIDGTSDPEQEEQNKRRSEQAAKKQRKQKERRAKKQIEQKKVEKTLEAEKEKMFEAETNLSSFVLPPAPGDVTSVPTTALAPPSLMNILALQRGGSSVDVELTRPLPRLIPIDDSCSTTGMGNSAGQREVYNFSVVCPSGAKTSLGILTPIQPRVPESNRSNMTEEQDGTTVICNGCGRSLPAHLMKAHRLSTCRLLPCGGCGVLGLPRFAAAHAKECPQRKVHCVFCAQNIPLIDHPQHHCQYAPEACNRCHELVATCDIEAHVRDSCSARFVACSLGCGATDITAAQIQEHESLYCSLCPQWVCACGTEVHISQRLVHLSECDVFHDAWSAAVEKLMASKSRASLMRAVNRVSGEGRVSPGVALAALAESYGDIVGATQRLQGVKGYTQELESFIECGSVADGVNNYRCFNIAPYLTSLARSKSRSVRPQSPAEPEECI